MPELPETESTKRALAPLIGLGISGFNCDLSKMLRVTGDTQAINGDIFGRRITGLRRIGKVIIFELEERLLAFHQRMSGHLTFANIYKGSERHIRVRMGLEGHADLLLVDPRKFAVVWYGAPEEVMAERYLAELGPDALTVSKTEFLGHLSRCRGQLKPAMLRQDVVAGLGNYLVDEILWRAKLDPHARVEELTKAHIYKIYKAMRELLDQSIAAGGLSLRDWLNTDGSGGKTEAILRVYSLGGRPCRRCRTPIKRIVVAGRGTWVCSKCQNYA
jgi:formamidopyrimidine-DNA glycosylase